MRFHRFADMLIDDFRPISEPTATDMLMRRADPMTRAWYPEHRPRQSLRARVARKYRTLYADPPWWEVGGGKITRGAQRHYPLMKTYEITSAMLWVTDNYLAWDSHLYLWVTNNHLEDGLLVMRSVGYRYITTITWFKDRPGLGQYYRGMTEHCLFGVRGRLPYRTLPDGRRAQGRTGFDAPRIKHSQKPDEMRHWIETVSHGPYLELFARSQHTGWTCWGDELGVTL